MSADADRRDRFQLVVTGLGTLLLLTVVALLVVTLLWRTEADRSERADQAVERAEAGEAAEAAARKAVVAMTSYRYQTAEEDFAWVEDAGTEKFREQYAELSTPVKELVVRLKATADGSVVASAPVVEDVDHVTVLLFVDQELTSQSGTGQRSRGLDQPRVLMTMVREDGRWLVDAVELKSLDNSR
jgi:Mce-associated membrane protein